MPGSSYLVSWRTRAPQSGPWSQCGSPSVNLQIKSFLGEPLGLRAGARPRPVASQVASIRCWPARDSRAANPKAYGTAALTRLQARKKQHWSLQTAVFPRISYCSPLLGLLLHSLFPPLPPCESPRVSRLLTLQLPRLRPLSPPLACLTEVSFGQGASSAAATATPPLLCALARGPSRTSFSRHHGFSPFLSLWAGLPLPPL